MPHPATIPPHKPEPPIGHSFTALQSVDSTNNYAMAQVHAGLARHGMAIFAREQYAGRGQRGRTWVAAPGDNITMSVVLEPHFLSLSQQFQLSAALSLAIHDFLQSFTLTPFYIKWPNDLYWGDRKAAGILIESILKGDKWAFAVAGIGININQ